MLFWVETGTEMTTFHGNKKSFLELGKRRLSQEELIAVEEFINEEIDKCLCGPKTAEGKHFYNPGWKAPKDWTPTPLQPIFEKACGHDALLAAFWYGLITMDVIISRGERWLATKTTFQGRNFDQAVYWTEE